MEIRYTEPFGMVEGLDVISLNLLPSTYSPSLSKPCATPESGSEANFNPYSSPLSRSIYLLSYHIPIRSI